MHNTDLFTKKTAKLPHCQLFSIFSTVKDTVMCQVVESYQAFCTCTPVTLEEFAVCSIQPHKILNLSSTRTLIPSAVLHHTIMAIPGVIDPGWWIGLIH